MLKPLTFEGRFESGFDELAAGKVCAVAAVIQANGMGLGLAVANEPGYHAIPLHWCNSDNWNELRDHATALNAELFDLDEKAAAIIVCSSMGAQNKRRRAA